MKKLENYTDEELRAEAVRREKVREAKAKPRQMDIPDWSYVRSLCEEWIDAMAEAGRPPKDGKQYIFEATMEALYGKAIWPYLNHQRIR